MPTRTGPECRAVAAMAGVVALAAALLAGDGGYEETFFLGGRKGTLADLRKANPPNVAKAAFPKPVVAMDASKLSLKEHFTRASRVFKVKPNTDYTFLFEVKAEGDGYVSAGVRWKMPDAPPGLVDKEEFVSVLKAPRPWTLRSFTFTSDPDKKATNAQVLLKAYGGVKASFRNVRLVEGWYADNKVRFRRPFKGGERKW